MEPHAASSLLEDKDILLDRIYAHLGPAGRRSELPAAELKKSSVVLFLLSRCRRPNGDDEICLILNKRSPQVRQAGDLCCPGGGIAWTTDRILAKLLAVPGAPLWRRSGRQRRKSTGGALNLLLAAGLREAWEEMRLNPLRVRYLGMLPEQHLVMFDRVIFPMVGWTSPQLLKPNWEVERIVYVPLRKLLDSQHYGRFRPTVAGTAVDGDPRPLRMNDFPCFIHRDDSGCEMLWGATYRITQTFLELIFDFSPPDIDHLPLAHRQLDDTYLNGSRWQTASAHRSGKTDW